ncbi:SDR family NAD(P)-dependent oxidoreductase [Deinococcus sp.]|uniref:SDR family NAD(P)-dependent oxidoreductase n=1 Tax=Deinococcus sp. TaxID=47478 RepID=UPI0025F85FFD|nr:SDR family NAD(P)-dependent oxidoreductase [Deinococcus sp.]
MTGVSTGIGWGTAKVLTRRGVRVFGSVRTQADAERLQAEFGERFTPLIFDVTDEAAVRRGAAQVAEALGGQTLRDQTLGGLVNNAGASIMAPLAEQPISDVRRQLDINLVGPLIVTQAFLPQLGTDRTLRGKPGRIVNVSSVGAELAPPFLGAYVASKAGLEGLSHSLRRELTPYGIGVVIVAPGSVATPIWDKGEADVERWAGHPVYGAAIRSFAATMLRSGRAGYTPEQLGEAIWTALSAANPAIRYAPGPETVLTRLALSVLPRRLLDRLLSRQIGLGPLPQR